MKPGPEPALPDRDRIQAWAQQLGFDRIGITGVDLDPHEANLLAWLERGYHGRMDYMARHGTRRSRPPELVPGTLSVISARMNYWPRAADAWQVLAQSDRAYVSRYALGRDYHKLMRKRLQQLAERLREQVGELGYRVFVDSAPVLEKPLASQAGLGWIGKHTNLIDRHSGSWFFLGEIYTNLPLPPDPADPASHCGRCDACIQACPTGAIVAPYRLDARLCISYLTIEHPGAIPEPLRPQMGNRIYGCDDCQLVCPWNRFARITELADFNPRQGLDQADLLDLFGWSESQFLERTEGSPIRRIGHARWLRNIAVALGNLRPRGDGRVIEALRGRLQHDSELVREHVAWALGQQCAES